MGCLWAASLCHHGMTPRLILRENSHQRLGQKRIPLKLTTADQTLRFEADITSPDTIDGPINRLIVCTKAQDALPAITSVKQHLHENSQILLLQNGMGSQQAIREAFPARNIWAGSSTDGAYLSAPFEVCHAGQGQTWIGPLNNRTSAASGFNDLLDNFRLRVSQYAPIEEKLWEKLAINCCINGLTALFNCRNGELLDNGEKQAWLDQLIGETATVLTALEFPANALRERVYGVCRVTAENISSTCQDARSGRTTELPFINGFLLRQANALGIALDYHHRLMDQLSASGNK